MESCSSVSSCCGYEEGHNNDGEDDGGHREQDGDETVSVLEATPQVRQVYLITYSQANLEVFPTRRSFAECICEAFRETGAAVKQWVCCRERHTDEGHHYHMAVKLERLRRWSAVKTYLQDRYNIVVNFSNHHDNYYSAWKYITKEDEEVLQSVDHPHLWNTPPPKTQNASAKRATASRMGVSAPAKKRKRLSSFDLSQIIVDNGIKTRTELLAFAQQQKQEGKTDVAEFVVNRGARVVAEVLDTAWEMEGAQKKLDRSNKSRMDILRDVLEEDCVENCNGLWYYCAHETLERNGIQKATYVKAVCDLLEQGRGKYRNIFIVGPANCGKTFMLNPLNNIYTTFSNPATTTFAWVGAETAECVFLNDFRWSAQLIPWHDLLLLLEGQPVHLPAPKTHYARDLLFANDTPIFATGKNPLVYIKNGAIDERETDMMSVRWKVFFFNRQFNESEQRDIPACGKCFARFHLNL